MGHPVDETAEPAEFDDGDPSEAAHAATVRTDAAAVDSEHLSHEDATGAVADVGGVDPREVLATLDGRPLTEHAEVYEELHTHLQRTLAEIDGG